MICPHCKKHLEFVVTAVRAKSTRAEYFRQRYLKSGKAKVRTSVDQDGKCIDCGAPTIGIRWYCEDCRKLRRAETARISSNQYYKNKHSRKAVNLESTTQA